MGISLVIKQLIHKHEGAQSAGSGSTLWSRVAVLLTTLSAITLIALPTSASAGGSVHVDIPGLSIGVHENHYNKKRHRRVYKNRHRNNHYRNDYYYDDHRDRKRYHKKRYYNGGYYKKRYYKKRYYNNDYYYGERSNRYNRRAEICPIAGYSPYYNDNLDCYRHKDHFHCS